MFKYDAVVSSQRQGYTRVLGITDSRSAVETCMAFGPDLLPLDLIMRGEADESFFPIVVLTADITEESKARALEAGATDFLVKPVSQTEALLRIRNLLETRRLYIALENQRSALEDAVCERTSELQETIAKLQAANESLQKAAAFSGA
jgi:putative two-component system response regulator